MPFIKSEQIKERTKSLFGPMGSDSESELWSDSESDSESPLETASERTSPMVVLSSTVPIDLYHLLCEAVVTCVKHNRLDIIITYVCNLEVTPKDVFDIARELKQIANLKNTIDSTFVPIRY
jgi:hypothetical protein